MSGPRREIAGWVMKLHAPPVGRASWRRRWFVVGDGFIASHESDAPARIAKPIARHALRDVVAARVRDAREHKSAPAVRALVIELRVKGGKATKSWTMRPEPPPAVDDDHDSGFVAEKRLLQRWERVITEAARHATEEAGGGPAVP